MKVITVARKPLEGTVAANSLKYGTGGLNIDGCRVRSADAERPGNTDRSASEGYGWSWQKRGTTPPSGRWPANLILQHLDGCQQTGTEEVACEPGCPVAILDEQSGESTTPDTVTGDASRFFKQVGGQAIGEEK